MFVAEELEANASSTGSRSRSATLSVLQSRSASLSSELSSVASSFERSESSASNGSPQSVQKVAKINVPAEKGKGTTPPMESQEKGMDVEKVLESDWPVGMPLAPGLMKKREAEVVTKLSLIIAECNGPS